MYTGEWNPFNVPYGTFDYIPANYTVLQSYTITTDNEQARRQDKINQKKRNEIRTLFIGSYTPRRCGLAKFLKHLISNYPSQYGIIAVDETSLDIKLRNYTEDVVYRIRQNEREDYYTAAKIANSDAYDVVNIQHEYGIYGGMSGEYIVSLLAAIQKPVLITMHT